MFGVLLIKGAPKIFAEIEETEVYKGNKLGDVTIKFVNIYQPSRIAPIPIVKITPMIKYNCIGINPKKEMGIKNKAIKKVDI